MPSFEMFSPSFTSLVSVTVLFLTGIFSVLGFRRFRPPRSTHYGPPTLPVLGCLLPFYKNRLRLLDWYTELLAESPSETILIDRLGASRTVVTGNPDNIEYILKTKFDNFPKGRPFTELLGDLLGRGIFNVDGEMWHSQRKLASHEFTAKSLREFLVRTLETEVNERLMPILEAACTKKEVVNMQEILKRFAFDVVCKLSLGMDPACLEPSLPDSKFAKAFDVAAEISARRGTAPVFAVWEAKRALSIGSEKRLKEAMQVIRGSVVELIRSRKDESRKKDIKTDLLSRLVTSGLDEELIRDMIISFIMAGRDTTSAAMTWFFWLLSCHKEVEKELVQEVETATGHSNEERSINYENMKEMKFLKACLCESMRLYPPVAWDSKHAAANDILPDGTRVYKGDRVTYFPYGMGRMKKIWGEDCQDFKPNRWIDAEDHTISPYKFPIFQAGPRVCLGKEMAFIQMKYVVASILEQFELVPVRQDIPAFVPLLTAHMAGGLNVSVQRRKEEDWVAAS
ncbi:cytochrome P450 94B3-like [Aristolochia californica]|uniref:cytochrome P450 94B3-like n=1 Tax=Aristolochia californica TaxID=171875 RepID=UPI0035DC2F02